MPRKIDAGELLAGLGGLCVLVSLFLEWFGPASGWEAFESLDLVLAALGLAAIAVAAAGLGSGAAAGGTVTPRALLPLGALLVLIVVVQIVEPPPAIAAEDDVDTGAWLGLVGGALVLLGGILRVARIDVTVSVGGRDVRPRVPAVDRRSARASRASGAGALPSSGGRPSIFDDDEPTASASAGARRTPLDDEDDDPGHRSVRAGDEGAGDEPFGTAPEGGAPGAAPAVDEAARRRDDPGAGEDDHADPRASRDPQATQPFRPVEGGS